MGADLGLLTIKQNYRAHVTEELGAIVGLWHVALNIQRVYRYSMLINMTERGG